MLLQDCMLRNCASKLYLLHVSIDPVFVVFPASAHSSYCLTVYNLCGASAGLRKKCCPSGLLKKRRYC